MDSSASPIEDDIIIQESVEYESEKQDILESVEYTKTSSKFHHLFSSYARKGEPVPLGRNVENLRILQLDVDYEIVEKDTFLKDLSSAAVVRIYGVTECGSSVLVRVHGFRPFFFIKCPNHFDPVDLPVIKESLEKRARKVSSMKNCQGPIIHDLEIFEGRSLLYFVPNDPSISYFKITVALPSYVRQLAQILERGDIDLSPYEGTYYSTFEASIDFVLRFMIETNMYGCSWVELPSKNCQLPERQTSYMQFEVDIHYNDMICHSPHGEWLKAAPIRILSFDIECAGRPGVFPEPEHDQVIQIANYLTEAGKSEPIARTVLTLGSCAPIAGAKVHSFDSEAELLEAWVSFLRVTDPDILTGYNIVNFDLPYLLNRANVLHLSSFPFLGRLIGVMTKMHDTRLSSSAFGTHESKAFTMNGRIIVDMLQILVRDYKLRSYSLNSVSFEFLGEQKEDVHHSIITELFRGNENTRRRLAVYCLKDAYLPQRLMEKLMSLTNYMELARVAGIPLAWLLSRGHMIKVVSLLHRKAFPERLLIPDLKNSSHNSGEETESYEGATVIEPKRGFYKMPIATLDFASLYPSIMMAHNICYSTLVRKDDVKYLKPEDYIKSPSGDCYVRPTVKKGVLSKILEDLLSARKLAKKELEQATDPFLRSVLNGRQLALKISANAVYGFTGASRGKLPCTEISASITAFGRQMIETTKSLVESKFPSSVVIYGDTDSVMVKFREDLTLEESMALGQQAAELISQSFPKPIKLEFEKCYYPYLLIQKKRYAGLLWTKTETYDKMDCKGIETVRRDNCKLVANVVSKVLEKLLVERDVQGAIDFVKKTISDLLQNKVDISLLVVSKELSKAAADYDANQAHVTLYKKLYQRDPGSAPSLGDRIPYVTIKGRKDQPAHERAEDPIYVLEHNLPLDTEYYLKNMLRKPLERIFEPIIGKNVSSLFEGEHTRSITVTTPSTGGIMRFTKVSVTCLGCRTPISETESKQPLCKYCKANEASIYEKILCNVREYERQYAMLWTQCQRCMGSICQDVLCSNSDCPIFYRRRKVQKDLEDASKQLGRFSMPPSW
ncbi:hypothetical protein GpartN1_g4417.t1 [Galdieria partita]|uniref:DNA polymerase n=1 Tax=Galdieria partita TaxID=83374 RepID=A0A9C7URB4_9RHOD|nr:hypothetical protein GpartN1_g4417.t1 [Galdieria partita]